MYTIYTLASDTSPNDIRYIGLTKKTIHERLRGHINEQSSNKKRTHKMYWIASVIANGDYVIATPIEYAETLYEAQEIEIKLIAKYLEEGYRLVNGTKGGEGGERFNIHQNKQPISKRYISDETRQKMSYAQRNRLVSKEWRNNHSKNVINRSCKYKLQQICVKNLVVIACYDGIYHAERMSGVKGKTIQAALSRGYAITSGYYWNKIDKSQPYDYTISKEVAIDIKAKLLKRLIKKTKQPKQPPLLTHGRFNVNFCGFIYQIDLNAARVIKRFESAMAAEKELGLSHGKISVCVQGKRIQTGGYGWIRSHNHPTNEDIIACVKRFTDFKKNCIFHMKKMQKYQEAS